MPNALWRVDRKVFVCQDVALRAFPCAGLPTGDAYVCPVDPDVSMPMIFVDDLMNGLIALQEVRLDACLLTAEVRRARAWV